MPSPIRRSARGQPPAASSTTSSLSSRQDRGMRINNAQKSGTPRSLSSEEASEPPIARRSQRQPAQKEDSSAKDVGALDDNEEEAADEEEITRCICGHQEYPGPPLSEAFAGIPDAQSEDAGGLFILCDGCTVWQHGGCVGIVEESQSPDKYFCEECHPKKHAVHTDSRGQKYSLYLPLHPKAQRKASMSKNDKDAKRERENAASRASVDPSTGKRRGTMRSKEHDDEEEQLKRAIEESKREVDGVATTARRNGKRGRDDSSEDSKQDVKRQRRASESVPSLAATASIENDSDDGSAPAARSKKAKAEAAMSARQAEQKEKDLERDKARAEAAGRRQERARTRRNDESEPVEETTPRPANNGRMSPPAPSSQPPTPPPAEKAPVRRGPGKKPPKKLGNNQYTKRRFEEAAASPHGRKNQTGTGSGDDASEIAMNGDPVNGTSKHSPPAAAENGVSGPGKGKFGRGKKAAMTNGNGVRNSGEEIEKTFTNMHGALVNMSTYVLRQQEEMTATGLGGEKSPVSSTAGGVMMIVGGALQPTSASAISDSSTERRFEELSCSEMAVELQKGIVEWQRQWGHLAAA